MVIRKMRLRAMISRLLFHPLAIQKGHLPSVLPGHTREYVYFLLYVGSIFGWFVFLSAEESYSQQVSAASFEWLVNMSMCEQWSCLTSAVLMRQLQMEKRALEELG